MTLAELVTRLIIPSSKLTRYALDPSAPYGRHKAILFEKVLGFTQENYLDLVFQLETKALENEAVFRSEDRFGKHYTVDLLIEGTEGRQATVRTIWLITEGSTEANLTTLYVKRR